MIFCRTRKRQGTIISYKAKTTENTGIDSINLAALIENQKSAHIIIFLKYYSSVSRQVHAEGVTCSLAMESIHFFFHCTFRVLTSNFLFLETVNVSFVTRKIFYTSRCTVSIVHIWESGNLLATCCTCVAPKFRSSDYQ